MATVATAITYARQKAQTDSNGISDTNGLAWANSGLLDITRELIKRNIDAAQTKESYATLSASDVPPGRFSWPVGMWMLKTVSINYQDSSQNNFIQANKVEVSNLQGDTSVDYLRLNQSTSKPLFTNHGDTGEVFPTPIGSAIIKIFQYIQPTEYSATSSAVSYPQSLDYRCLGDKIVEAYYQSQESFESAKVFGDMAIKKINDSIQILAPQSQQPLKAEPIHVSGWNL